MSKPGYNFGGDAMRAVLAVTRAERRAVPTAPGIPDRGAGLYPLIEGFTGTCYIGGRKVVLTGTEQAWVRVHRQNGTAEYDAGPAPDPFPPYEEWYETANTFGDIHCPA